MFLPARHVPASVSIGTHGPLNLKRLTLRPDELRTHLHVIGKSGSGKSRFLAGLFRSLFHTGAGITLLDPHGDLAEHVLRLLIRDGVYNDTSAFDRIVYLDLPEASRRRLALPFNVLKQPVSAHATASNVMDALHRYWPELGGGAAPRFDKLVQYGVKVLVSAGLSLPDLPRFLMDREFRERLLESETDQDIAWHWRQWYRELAQQPRLVLDYIDSTHSRAALLSFHPFLKHSLRSDELLLDFTKIMDEGRCVIVNLKLSSKEEWRVIGSLVTVLAEQAALRRSSGGRVHYLMLDEFANFIEANPESLNTFLSQTRKRNVFGCLPIRTGTKHRPR